MSRSTSPTSIITLSSRAGVVVAAIPVRRRRTAASDRLLFRLARRIFRSRVATMSVERRPVTGGGLSIDRGRPRGGARGLDGAHYDLLRQFR